MAALPRVNSKTLSRDPDPVNARIRPAEWLLSIASAVLLAAAQPPWGFSLVAWIALVPLLMAIRNKRLGPRLALGLTCGTVWAWLQVGHWLATAAERQLQIGPIAAALLSLVGVEVFGGLYVMLFAGAVRPAAGVRPTTRSFAVAAVWVAFELVRSRIIGGAPWCLLGHSQHEQIVVIQIADLGGVYALSFLIAAANVVIAGLVSSPEQAVRQRNGSLAVLVAIASSFAYGHLRLQEPAGDGATVTVQAVHTAWSEDSEDSPARLLARLLELTEHEPVGRAELLIWPENSLRSYLQEAPARAAELAALARRRGQHLLAGGPRYQQVEGEPHFYNSAYLFDASGGFLTVHDKRKLVPLAEARLGPFAGVTRPFESGASWAPLAAGRHRLGVLICFESIFPEPARTLVQGGANLLVNVSNDELLQAGGPQQAAMTVFRAVENRVPLIRVANRGQSYAVDAFGRVIDASPAGFGSLVFDVQEGAGGSLYNRWGDLFAIGCAVVALLWLLQPLRSLRTAVRS
jgi:apolipoprotein N-acyltransferase